MNVEELEGKIKEGKTALDVLEKKYETEEDEKKQAKLEFSISRKEEQINRLIDRQDALSDKENKEDEGKDKDVDEKDEDVCSECGGDLVLVGKDDKGEVDIYECEKCRELFLDE